MSSTSIVRAIERTVTFRHGTHPVTHLQYNGPSGCRLGSLSVPT
jgi:hypothetical protein